jgi:cyclopropane-fatty-acyl-phospholipid synthase
MVTRSRESERERRIHPLRAVSFWQTNWQIQILRRRLDALLGRADIRLNGSRPWDPQIHNENVYARVLANPSLGAGESYMEGWWDCVQLDEFFTRFFYAHSRQALRPGRIRRMAEQGMLKLINYQSRTRAFKVGQRHYDIGNELYQHMLDQRMIYSCAYWKDATTLDEAQAAKLDLICRKLRLEPGMRVLDIGCGWGGMARYAAEHYGVEVVGITVSEEQVRLAQETCRGLPVEIRLQDYRDLRETFDRILSVGMFEHVGLKNYATYMHVVRRCLKLDGLFVLQTIGTSDPDGGNDPWTLRYIFPNSMLPAMQHIVEASQQTLVIEDWHNFGPDYDRTLLAWYRNFEAAWDRLKHQYDKRFYRMWRYYLLSSASSFRTRHNHLWQIVFSPNGISGGYRAPR